MKKISHVIADYLVIISIHINFFFSPLFRRGF
jgi:hypothetical protein